jgi:hypothetical protein
MYARPVDLAVNSFLAQQTSHVDVDLFDAELMRLDVAGAKNVEQRHESKPESRCHEKKRSDPLGENGAGRFPFRDG